MTGTGGPLRIGFVGGGFMAQFHLRALLGVRNAIVAGVVSKTAPRREAFATRANAEGLGPCTAYPDLQTMLRTGGIDAIWIASPNHTRLDAMREIHAARKAGVTSVFAVACEKPLARTLAKLRAPLPTTARVPLSNEATLDMSFRLVHISEVHAGDRVLAVDFDQLSANLA